PPDQRERINTSKMKGRNAAPASVAVYPCTWIRFNGKKNNIPLSPQYRKSVSRFAPVKFFDRNRLNGSIGAGERASTNKKVIRAAAPTRPAQGLDSISA